MTRNVDQCVLGNKKMGKQPQRTTLNKKRWYNYSDANLYVWGTNLSKNVSDNEVILGVDAGELELIQDGITDFQNSVDALATAKAAYEAAVINKEAARASLIDTMRPFVGTWQSATNIPAEVYELLDIPEKAKPGPRTGPSIPQNLVAMPTGVTGVNFIWESNGNTGAVTYTIQQLNGTTWTNIWSGTRKRVTITGFAPGTQTFFRVVAIRNNQTSEPSNTAVIYQLGESSQVFNLEAA